MSPANNSKQRVKWQGARNERSGTRKDLAAYCWYMCIVFSAILWWLTFHSAARPPWKFEPMYYSTNNSCSVKPFEIFVCVYSLWFKLTKRQSLSRGTNCELLEDEWIPAVYKISIHDGIIKRKHFACYWSFVWGTHRSPVNSLPKARNTELWFFFDPRLNKQLRKQWRRRWFATPLR